jgi:hypothetical protein
MDSQEAGETLEKYTTLIETAKNYYLLKIENLSKNFEKCKENLEKDETLNLLL